MADASLLEHSLPENIIQPLFRASNSCDLERSLEVLIEASKSADIRSDLASKNVLHAVLELIRFLLNLSSLPQAHLLLSLKLLRNLCAGEINNQSLFIERKGVGIVLSVMQSSGMKSDPDPGMIRMGLQVLANVSLAGEEHRRAIWQQLFPDSFISLARVRRRETSDPLCMIIYACCSGCPELIAELCGESGLPIVAEIVRTASAVGFGEDWLKLLISKICLEESYFPPLFPKLSVVDASNNAGDSEVRRVGFSKEQVFLLRIMSEILNERLKEIAFASDAALFLLGIFKMSVQVLASAPKGESGLPTGIPEIDVLGYSLTILRDICAQDSSNCSKEGSEDAVEELLSSALIDLLLCLLRTLDPPAIIKKGIRQAENVNGTSSCASRPCPYKGFRRDIVAVIGNCAFYRKHVQDDIRRKNGILLLLQQCVTDEDNPFLREWGIWSVRNLLEGNSENQRVVAELELQGSVDVPEISALGLRVEVNQKTGRVKLVNAS